MLSYLTTRLLPSILIFAALLGAALLADLLLHWSGLAWVGRWLGPLGTGLLAVSFLHSLRRRKRIRMGSPKGLLRLHEVLGWLGGLVLLVHGGIHLNAVIPWLALLAMVVVVASGLTGKFLLAEARGSVAARRGELASQGLEEAEVERQLMGLALLTSVMQRWRSIHMPLTMTFAGLALVHIVLTLLLW
ncbi:MAG: hypothetical protein Q8O14_09740 [bacterium]|jgi:hypothetical protein|nr:hypothetical protein [bacterium]